MKLTSCYASFFLVAGSECLFADGPTTIQPSQNSLTEGQLETGEPMIPIQK